MQDNYEQDEQLHEAIHAVVDGAATSEQAAIVDATSGEVRDQIEAQRRIAARLDSFPIAEPPASIRNDVMAELRSRVTAPAAAPIDFRAARDRRRKMLFTGWAAAAAILIVVAIYPVLFTSDQVDNSHAAATIGALGIEEWPVLAGDQSAGSTLTVRRNGDDFAVQTTVARRGPVAVQWDPKSFELIDFSPDSGVKTSDGEVRFPGPGGTVVVRNRGSDGAPGTVVVAAGGQPILRAPLKPE